MNQPEDAFPEQFSPFDLRLLLAEEMSPEELLALLPARWCVARGAHRLAAGEQAASGLLDWRGLAQAAAAPA